MTIAYCDYITGNDTTGDGTFTLPWQTIDKASTGLTGGDEVRVAASPAAVDISGVATLTFTINSTTITSSADIFVDAVTANENDTSIRLGDFIKGADNNWYEVITWVSNTQATLYRKYSGATTAGVNSYKLRVTSTGAATASTTVIQQLSASGVSAGSMLKVSGGWTLATQIQDGQTYFRQLHGTFANRYGYGLQLSSRTYVEIERLHFLRYAYGIYLASSNNNTITTPTCNSNATYGIYLSSSNNNTITTPTCNSNATGIYLTSSNNNTITTPTCNSNATGIYLTFSNNNTITTPTCNSNTTGIYLTSASQANKCISYSGTGNTADISVASSTTSYHEFPICSFQRYQLTAGDNRSYFNYGITYRDTANARSGECLEYACTSASLYSSHSFFFATESGYDSTLTAYIKKSATFDGDVQGAIYFLGEKITGWTAITPTANDTYEQKSLVASGASIIEVGVLELRIKVRGTAGGVYVDDLGVSY